MPSWHTGSSTRVKTRRPPLAFYMPYSDDDDVIDLVFRLSHLATGMLLASNLSIVDKRSNRREICFQWEPSIITSNAVVQ